MLHFLPTWYHKSLFFESGDMRMQSGKFIDFLNVCKCGMLCVNFHSVAVYNSSVMEFWPLPLEQRITLFSIA